MGDKNQEVTMIPGKGLSNKKQGTKLRWTFAWKSLFNFDKRLISRRGGSITPSTALPQGTMSAILESKQAQNA